MFVQIDESPRIFRVKLECCIDVLAPSSFYKSRLSVREKIPYSVGEKVELLKFKSMYYLMRDSNRVYTDNSLGISPDFVGKYLEAV